MSAVWGAASAPRRLRGFVLNWNFVVDLSQICEHVHLKNWYVAVSLAPTGLNGGEH